MAYNYNDFYKIGNDIYRANGQKLTYAEALPMFQNGFNAAFIPEKQPTQNQQSQTPSLSESGKYFKSGNDVYEAGTNRHIDQNEFQRLGLNFALLPQGQAPVAPPPALVTPQLPDTGDPLLNQLLSSVQSQLDSLTNKGQTINPNIEITPEKTAEFLTQAQKEISPYYAGQMKIAREGLLREAGYTSDEIAQSEAKIEKQYGQSLRTLSGNMAESGFALSGQRQEGERTLAEDTQSGIDSARKTAEYNAGNSARQFASEWGGGQTPQFNYGAAPKVQAGQEKFSRSLDLKPFYSISDSVLSGLTGSRTFEQQAREKARQSELEGLWRTQEANKQRLLNL